MTQTIHEKIYQEQCEELSKNVVELLVSSQKDIDEDIRKCLTPEFWDKIFDNYEDK